KENDFEAKENKLKQKARVFLDKKKEELSKKYEGAALDSAMQSQYEKVSDKIEQEFEKDNQIFIDHFKEWQDKARHQIAVEKITFSDVENKMIKHYGAIYRPVDKRENYIKRCIGIPGDSISIENAQVYVNGE